jgi:hypothetical protein
LKNQAWIQQLKNIADTSGMETAAEVYPWPQLLYPCLMCQGYTSAAVFMPDASGVCLSCCIHAWFFTGILQLLYPCIPDTSSMDTAAAEYPWHNRDGYSSWRITLTNQACI